MLRSAQVRAEFAEEIVVRARFLGFCSGSQLRAGFAENTVLRAGSWAKCLGPREADLEARVLPKCQETAAIRATTRLPLW